MSPQPRSRSIVRGLLAALGTLAISVPGLACGDDGGGGGSAYGGAATEAASTTSTTEAAAGAGEVAAFDFGFDPNTTTISAGDRLTWENTGETTHNVKGKGFFSDGMEPGDTFEHKFAEAGVYDYLCTLHPDSMTGTVVVE